MAFGDVVVPQLKGIAKAIYSGGRFVAVADGAAVFALDNAPTRERAEKHRPAVEQLLAAHFGTAVPLRLVIESEVAAGAGSPAAAPPAGSASSAGLAPDAASAPPAGSVPVSESAPPAGAGAGPSATGGDEEAELMAQVDELEDADVTTTGVDKLTQAFPGAELIENEERR